MDVKDAERVVIAKPVASRPSCSSFKSFSELLAGAINASPSNTSETAVAAIRPKTVRFKPMVNPTVVGLVSPQAEISPALCNPSEKASKSDGNSTVVYKPLAKVVSKATVSLLANMGNSNNSQQLMQSSVGSQVQYLNQDKYNLRSNHNSNLQQNLPSQAERNRTIESSKKASHNLAEDSKVVLPTANADRPSYDGYNWRKYGQKQVKGSEYPRSYYKCTHPNCPVKKKVERSLDGQIAEIVYKGEHNHLKPQPTKRSSSGTQALGIISDVSGQENNNQLWNSDLQERNEGSEGRIENHNEMGLTVPTYQSRAILPHDALASGVLNCGAGTSDNSCGPSGECEEGSKGLEAEDDGPRSKRRRKGELRSSETCTSGEAALEPRGTVQNSLEPEIIGDGFRWRKYGQKVVKGNPYPRSYYRCTNIKCNVRKHVERTSDDPGAFITTYEGKHNHDMPLRNSNIAVTSETQVQASTIKDRSSSKQALE